MLLCEVEVHLAPGNLPGAKVQDEGVDEPFDEWLGGNQDGHNNEVPPTPLTDDDAGDESRGEQPE